LPHYLANRKCSTTQLYSADNSVQSDAKTFNYSKCSQGMLFLCLYISLRFNGHFAGGPVLVGTSMSPFWILLELRVMEVVVTTGSIRRAELQSKCHHLQTNTQVFTGQMPFLSPSQQRRSTEVYRL